MTAFSEADRKKILESLTEEIFKTQIKFYRILPNKVV